MYRKSQKKYNEIYLLIKYIKSVLWTVAERLSYVEDAWWLKVKSLLHVSITRSSSRSVCCSLLKLQFKNSVIYFVMLTLVLWQRVLCYVWVVYIKWYTYHICLSFNDLKFTLKHLKRSYMFRSYDHPQGAYIVPY